MMIPIAFLIQSTGLFVAAKLLNVNLSWVTAPIVVLCAVLTSHYIVDIPTLIVALVTYMIMIKLFDRSCDLFQFLGLFLVAFIIEVSVVDLVIKPYLNYVPPYTFFYLGR